MRKSTWTVLGAIVVIAAAIIIYSVVHKPAATTSSNAKAVATTQPKTTPTLSNSSGILQTRTTDPRGDQYLADSNGNALYTFGADTKGKSNCLGTCLDTWPIYNASNAPATLPTNVTVITRTDGGKQYAYKGKPLYTFTGDTSGKVTGDNISDFHVAKP